MERQVSLTGAEEEFPGRQQRGVWETRALAVLPEIFQRLQDVSLHEVTLHATVVFKFPSRQAPLFAGNA